jgi:type VII secretion-associated protein (TIGR03931 family)
VTAHVIEVGPNVIRRLCCGGGTVVDREAETAALEGVDDPVTLVDSRPVAVESLWRTVLESLGCGGSDRAIVIHPSWWAPARVNVVTAAAQVLGGEVVMRPRPWLLRQVSAPEACDTTLVVEIADGLVVITGATVAAETRRRHQPGLADAVARSIRTMASGFIETVVIDAPRNVHGAGALAEAIATALGDFVEMTTMAVDDVGMKKLVAEIIPDEAHTCDADSFAVAKAPRRRWTLVRAALLIGALLGAIALIRHPVPQAGIGVPTTFLVEGHVALQVPAQWPVRRVVAGPGSARLQITSPSDPEVALHLTQSRVALATLAATVEFLKNAIDGAPDGAFVDFDPVGHTAGRPAATYREIRPVHDIRWTVWVDKDVRISVGCQSRHGHEDAVSQECALAVRSARAMA